MEPFSKVFQNPFSRLLLTWQKLGGVLGGRRRSILFIVAVLVWLGFSVFPPISLELERLLIDHSRNLGMSWRTPHPSILLVAIDSETLAAVPERWPWKRKRYADFLQLLSRGSPRFVIWDFLLQHEETQDSGEGDQAFAKTIRDMGNVILVSLVEEKSTPIGLEKKHYRNSQIFRDNGAMEGFVWGMVDSDGSIRTFVCEDPYLGLKSAVLQVCEVLDPSVRAPGIDGRGLSRSFLAFANSGGEIPIISALDIMEERIPPDLLRGKIVVVGANAPVLHDYHPTSRGLIAGSRLLAASLDTLLRHRAVTPAESWEVRLVSSLLGGILGLLLTALVVSHPFAWSLIGLVMSLALWVMLLEVGCVHVPGAPFSAAWLFLSAFNVIFMDFLGYLDQEAIRVEAKAAAGIQKMFFPERDWFSEEYSVRGFSLPCSSVGGDFYDFVPVENGGMLFILADVTGHGFGAAMVTPMIKALVANLCEDDQLSLEAFGKRINSVLFRVFHRRKLMTAVMGDLRPGSHRVTITSAGHLPSMLVKNDGTIQEVGFPAYPIGAKKVNVMRLQGLNLEEGDTLVLFTDGVIEALDWNDDPYGFEKWKRSLSQVMPNLRRDEPLEILMEDILRHTNGRPLEDDLTILIIARRRKGP